MIENRQKLRGRDDFNRSEVFKIGKVMVPGNEIIDPTCHGALQDAVIRKVLNNGYPSYFFDDEGRGSVADMPFPGQLKDGFGVAAEGERRNNDVGVNYYP